MDNEIFSKIVINSEKQIENVKRFNNHRYLFNLLSKASEKFYHGIYGIRGIGKTIMLLQLTAKYDKPLYISVDAKYLLRFDVYDIVTYAIDKGYENIFIDEIHTKSKWTSDLKTLYDETNAKIFFTGSSSMELQKNVDLSRRAIIYELKPASFREYLNIKKNANIKTIHIKDLFNYNKRKEFVHKYSKWNIFMKEYYKYGGMLYEGIKEEYPNTILNVLDKMLTVDLSSLREIDTNAINNIYKMLYKISSSGPYEASYSNIASYLGISKATSIKFVNDLSKIGLLVPLYPCRSGFRKEPKIFLRIPFRQTLNTTSNINTDIGVRREEFFVNNIDVKCYFKTKRGEKTPDFKLGEKVIEVSGQWRKSRIADYIAVDGLNYQDNNIPLFLFGMLY